MKTNRGADQNADHRHLLRSSQSYNGPSTSHIGNRPNSQARLFTPYERRRAKKICRVCGDKAFSYNFNVITCESCKAFFRRNAHKNKGIRCPFNNTCNITTLSRRFCQRCRLEKCFSVGMKKEWIMSEKARYEKRQRIMENNERRSASLNASTMGTATTRSDTINHTIESLLGNRIQRPVPIVPDEASRRYGDFGTAFVPFTCFGGDSITTTSVMTTSPLTFDTSSLRATEVYQPPVFGETSFRPPAQTHAATNFIAPTFQPLNNFTFNSAPDYGITSQVQLNAELQRAAQIEQYLQQQAAVQTIPQPFPNTICPPIPFSIGTSAAGLPQQSLMRLLDQNNTNTPQPHPPHFDCVGVPRKCQCLCSCGRYEPSSPIVDEVMKDILARPISNISSNSNSSRLHAETRALTENRRDSDLFLSPFNLSNRAYSLKSNQSTAQNKRRSPPAPPPPTINTRTTRRRHRASIMEEEIDTNKDENSSYVDVDSDFCLLTSSDQDRLSEIVAANAVWSELEPNSPDKERHERGCNNFYELINMADGALRKMVKMTKKITAFQHIEHHDQLVLLKGGCLEYIFVRSALSYYPKKRCWKSPDSASGYLISLNTLQEAPENFFAQLIRYYSQFKNEFRTNKYVMLLESMLVLFDPDQANLKNKEAVERERAAYKRVLKRLLFSLCGQDQMKANEELKVMLANVYEARRLGLKARKIFKELDSSRMEPLLLEMFCK